MPGNQYEIIEPIATIRRRVDRKRPFYVCRYDNGHYTRSSSLIRNARKVAREETKRGRHCVPCRMALVAGEWQFTEVR